MFKDFKIEIFSVFIQDNIQLAIKSTNIKYGIIDRYTIHNQIIVIRYCLFYIIFYRYSYIRMIYEHKCFEVKK